MRRSANRKKQLLWSRAGLDDPEIMVLEVYEGCGDMICCFVQSIADSKCCVTFEERALRVQMTFHRS